MKVEIKDTPKKIVFPPSCLPRLRYYGTIVLFVFSFLYPVPLLAGPAVLHDMVLKTDTEWSGEIMISGVVVVGRNATLRIEPGTTIFFKKIDRNRDGIGDSEIRITGRLLAVGSPDRPIRFVSDEQAPAGKDWSYVLIFASGKENKIQHCEFRHAFTGLQVHFSTAVVSDSLFKDNNEGMRFGRARLNIERNRFVGNDVGVRFTRMEGPVLLRHNDITGNRIGVFLVPSGQNITDFFEPDRSRPWNTGRLTIISNNIHDNSRYDVNFGEKQYWDLEATGNWWGTQDPEQIEAKFFAQNRDQTLGLVLFRPFADQPFVWSKTGQDSED